MASLADDLALTQALVTANAPQLAQNDSALLTNILSAFVSAANQTAYLVTSSTPNMFVSSATGDALKALAADRGVTVFLGTAATAYCVFKTSQPVPTGTTVTIPVGTVVSTVGDGITATPIAFTTTNQVTITAGNTLSTLATLAATSAGTAGNVAEGTITVIVTPGLLGTLSVSNAHSDVVAAGGTSGAGTGGQDAWDDAQIRAACQANLIAKYGAAAVQAQLLATPGCYDAYVLDPQNGNGAITYYFCDSARGQTVITPTAAAAAVNAVLPPNITATGTTFSVVNLTSISVSYSAPAAVQAATIEPRIQQAVINYINGTADGTVSAVAPSSIGAQTGLIHNQVPTSFGLAQYVQQAVGYVLTNCTLTASTPAIGSASNTTIYETTGGTSAIHLTRV